MVTTIVGVYVVTQLVTLLGACIVTRPRRAVVRWDVVDCDGTVIHPAMWRRENAEREALRLNVEGLSDFAPYSVRRARTALSSETTRGRMGP